MNTRLFFNINRYILHMLNHKINKNMNKFKNKYIIHRFLYIICIYPCMHFVIKIIKSCIVSLNKCLSKQIFK